MCRWWYDGGTSTTSSSMVWYQYQQVPGTCWYHNTIPYDYVYRISTGKIFYTSLRILHRLLLSRLQLYHYRSLSTESALQSVSHYLFLLFLLCVSFPLFLFSPFLFSSFYLIITIEEMSVLWLVGSLVRSLQHVALPYII